MKQIKIVFLMLVASLAAGDAFADINCPALGSPPVGAVPDRKLAHELFKQAQRYYDESKFREAAAAFVASYHGSPNEVRPALIYNVGKATERAGDLVNAAAFYRCYLETNPPAGPGRNEATTRLAAIEQSVPQARVAPIDTKWNDPPKPPSGIIPRVPIYEQWEEPTNPSQSRHRIWTLVMAGVTGAALATGIGFGISSERKFQGLTDRGCAATPDGCPRDEVQTIERDQLIANIAFGVAGVGAVATGVLWFFEGRSATVGVKVNPSGASAMIRW